MSQVKEVINLCSDTVTILAFVLAIIAFLNWKKEHKYAKKLDYILNLEDSFIILFHNIKQEFKFFSDMQKNLVDIVNKTEEDKNNIYISIKKNYEIYLQEQLFSKSLYEYNIALVRIKRFIKDIDKECEVLDFNYLKELNLEGINLTPKWEDKDKISAQSIKFLERINEIEIEGIKYLQKKYK